MEPVSTAMIMKMLFMYGVIGVVAKAFSDITDIITIISERKNKK